MTTPPSSIRKLQLLFSDIRHLQGFLMFACYDFCVSLKISLLLFHFLLLLIDILYFLRLVLSDLESLLTPLFGVVFHSFPSMPGVVAKIDVVGTALVLTTIIDRADDEY